MSMHTTKQARCYKIMQNNPLSLFLILDSPVLRKVSLLNCIYDSSAHTCAHTTVLDHKPSQIIHKQKLFINQNRLFIHVTNSASSATNDKTTISNKIKNIGKTWIPGKHGNIKRHEPIIWAHGCRVPALKIQ